MGRLKIDRNTCKYYSDRVGAFRGISDEGEKDAFLMQTFLNFQKDGWQVALSPVVCKSLEELLMHANNDCLEVLMKTLSHDWEGVINSKFCYHVLHKALVKCQSQKLKEDSVLFDYILEFCDHMKMCLNTYVKNPHAAHTARLYLQIVGGVQIPKDIKTGTFDLANIRRYKSLDSEHHETITQLFERFLINENLSAYVCDNLMCPFVQILLITASIRIPELFEENIEKIQEVSGLFSRPEDEAISLFRKRLRIGYVHPTAIYFTETLIGLMPGKSFHDFFHKRILNFPKSTDEEKIPISTASIMSAHPIASRVLRAVIRRAVKVPDLLAILQSLERVPAHKSVTLGLAGALKYEQHAVLNDLALACSKSRSDDLQRHFLDILPPLFGVSAKKPTAALGEDRFIQCLVSLKHVNDLAESHSDTNKNTDSCDLETASSTDDSVGPVTLPGSLFTATLLKFKCPPTRIVASLCSQSPKRLSKWAFHPLLSRVLEGAIQSPSVPQERKLFIYNALKPQLPDLACDKCGSHVVESIWESIRFMKDSNTIRESFASTLAQASNRLKSHTYGHFSYKKCDLEQFEADKTVWLRRWSGANKLPPWKPNKRPIANDNRNNTGPKRIKTMSGANVSEY